METQTYNHLKLKMKYKMPKKIQVHGNAIFIYIDLKLETISDGKESHEDGLSLSNSEGMD